LAHYPTARNILEEKSARTITPKSKLVSMRGALSSAVIKIADIVAQKPTRLPTIG